MATRDAESVGRYMAHCEIQVAGHGPRIGSSIDPRCIDVSVEITKTVSMVVEALTHNDNQYREIER